MDVTSPNFPYNVEHCEAYRDALRSEVLLLIDPEKVRGLIVERRRQLAAAEELHSFVLDNLNP